MSNSYFRFKQFMIQQEQSAMKVTTDACLFGSLFYRLLKDKGNNNQVLDIGTGTGLLSLMYAQQFPHSIIDAVEIDKEAYIQAQQNFDVSEWKQRLRANYSDIKIFDPGYKYDVVISNPPFFENHLKSNDEQKNKALHEDGLTLKDLMQQINRLILPGGVFLLLLPYHRALFFKQQAMEWGWYCNEEYLVKQTDRHAYFRSILKFSKEPTPIKTSEIIIKTNNNYTDEFTELLKAFYLKL